MTDGRSLGNKYFGNTFLDKRLTLLSAFYDVLTNSFLTGPRLLFFDINFVVPCTNVGLIESCHRGVRNWF